MIALTDDEVILSEKGNEIRIRYLDIVEIESSFRFIIPEMWLFTPKHKIRIVTSAGQIVAVPIRDAKYWVKQIKAKIIEKRAKT